MAAHLPERRRRGQPGRPRLLPSPVREPRQARHHAVGDVVPLGPAAVAGGSRRLDVARDRRRVRDLCRHRGEGLLRRREELDHPQRDPLLHDARLRLRHQGAGPQGKRSGGQPDLPPRAARTRPRRARGAHVRRRGRARGPDRQLRRQRARHRNPARHRSRQGVVPREEPAHPGRDPRQGLRAALPRPRGRERAARGAGRLPPDLPAQRFPGRQHLHRHLRARGPRWPGLRGAEPAGQLPARRQSVAEPGAAGDLLGLAHVPRTLRVPVDPDHRERLRLQRGTGRQRRGDRPASPRLSPQPSARGASAIADGTPIDGYFLWSFID